LIEPTIVPEEIAHDVEELKADIAFERAKLGTAIKHDYSTARGPEIRRAGGGFVHLRAMHSASA
jgi:hypothetical protein